MKITKNTSLKDIQALSEDCQNCGKCCTMGSGFLIDKDIPKIAKYLGITEEELKRTCLTEKILFNKVMYKPNSLDQKGKPGVCVFYNKDNGCSIHDVKPFECKIASCNEHGSDIIEWFTLNYIVDSKDPKSIREWALKLKGAKTIEGGELKELVKDPEWLRKVLNMEIL